MLKVTQPYVRETPVRDEKEGKNICIKIEPPGFSIGFRLRHSRITYHLKVKDAYMAARYSPDPDIKEDNARLKPKHPSVKDEILNVLRAKGKLNIAQVMQQLKEKGMPVPRKFAGEYLELLKDTGKVKQEGFSYSLAQGGGK